MTQLSPQQQNQIDRARAMLAGLRNRHDGPSVALDAAAFSLDVQTPTWVQVATAGNYRGYAGGAFVFDANVFAQIIRNFRANPSYRAGTSDVIPWDFNHASASFAADGSIPVSGTPAQGWIRELDARVGPDGVPTLWTLTRWLEPARSYIRAGAYKWASVVVGFDCTDAKSGANIGAVLESVALTNSPFIAGMMPLVAASRGAMPRKDEQSMSLTLSRAPDGTVRLAAKAAEVGPNVSPFESAKVNPALNSLPNLDQTFFQEVLGRARAVPGFLNQTPEAVAMWLRGVDVANKLGLDDRHRCAILVGTILRTLGSESMPVGAGHHPGVAPIPTELSRLDARNQAGRNATERAVRAMRAVSPGFAAAGFDEQIALAGDALRQGRVIA
jgi:hypothetical protein